MSENAFFNITHYESLIWNKNNEELSAFSVIIIESPFLLASLLEKNVFFFFC